MTGLVVIASRATAWHAVRRPLSVMFFLERDNRNWLKPGNMTICKSL